MGLRDFTLQTVVARNAHLHGARTAFVFEGQRITHAQYHARAERLAAGLHRAGLAHGDRLCVLAQNRLEFLDAYAAAARLGAIVVPVNWRLTADEVTHVVRDTAPKLLLADPQYQATMAALAPQCPSITGCYGFDTAGDGFLPYEALLQGDGTAPAVDVTSDDGFVIVHTAAVGGNPRGALLSHGGLLTANLQLIQQWRLGPDDANLGMLPLFHVSGLGLFLAVLQAGGTTVLSPRFDPAAAARQVAEHRITVFSEFAPMLGSILDQAGDADLSSLRAVSGLDTPETIARFHAACPGAAFWSGYGQTEVSGMATLAPFAERPGAAGRPALLTEVAIVDDLDNPVPIGQTGEIVVRGPTVFKGYWNLDEDNRQTFRGGWHHTGDMGRLDADGYLWYAGRSPAKELIKPGGENVYPAEVERVVLEHPAVSEVVVIGVPDAQWGEAVKAVCVRRAGVAQPEAGELIDFVGARIARFKKPKHVVFVDALPRTSAGVIDRARVREEHGKI
ncbi:MAG TPA: AMP-binding protein [Quisquiliibacterium sp.]|nr:AMP-binding protein [Quisquiliibacterium sp.]